MLRFSSWSAHSSLILGSEYDKRRGTSERHSGSVLALGNKADLTDLASCALIVVVCFCLFACLFPPFPSHNV